VPDFVLGFGLVAMVLGVTGLIHGIVERSPVSFPLIFLGIGLAFGGGLGVIEFGPYRRGG
jgi:hypothetical protein